MYNVQVANYWKDWRRRMRWFWLCWNIDVWWDSLKVLLSFACAEHNGHVLDIFFGHWLSPWSPSTQSPRRLTRSVSQGNSSKLMGKLMEALWVSVLRRLFCGTRGAKSLRERAFWIRSQKALHCKDCNAFNVQDLGARLKQMGSDGHCLMFFAPLAQHVYRTGLHL